MEIMERCGLQGKKSTAWMAGVAGILCLAVFLRALSCGFVNFDDPQYVYDNPALKVFDWQFIAEAFRTSYLGWWMPLTWISLAADYAVWGLNPIGYHLTNILLHAVNTGVVVLIANRLVLSLPRRRFTYWVPLLAALLWGIHPLRVESVVWVTERKDVLNGLFSLVSILFYLRYVQHQAGAAGKGLLNYAVALGCFACSVMAKPVSVVLPVVFLFLDWYPLQRMQTARWQYIMAEKLPFFLIAGGSAIATLVLADGKTILIPTSYYPLGSRFLVAGYAAVEYLRMIVWPAGLTHFYPISPELPPAYYVGALLFLGITVVALVKMHRQPWLLSTWAVYLLPLLPVLGFFQNGHQSHADRFTYLPTALPAVAVAYVLVVVAERLVAQSSRTVALLLLTVVVSLPILLGAVSFRQIGYWQNSGTLWSRLLAVKPVGRAYIYRADYFVEIGKYKQAVTDAEEAIRMARDAGHPDIQNLYAFLGDALRRDGQYQEAIAAFSTAIAIKPERNFHYHRALAYQALGDAQAANADFAVAGSDHGPISFW